MKSSHRILDKRSNPSHGSEVISSPPRRGGVRGGAPLLPPPFGGRNFWLVLVGALVLSGSGCKNKTQAPNAESFPVHIQVAQAQPLEDTLIMSGSLKAQNEATLFSRVAGKLQENLLREGDPVKKGQPVALVERDEVGVSFEPAPVPSTLTGVVGRIFLDRGMNVGLDTPVALIVDDAKILAQGDVPERYVGMIRLGQTVKVSVEAYPGRAFQGRVTRMSPVVSPTSRTAPIEVTLDNAKKSLKSGMYAEMSIVVARIENALVVPAAAVIERSAPALFIAKDGKAEKRVVHLGLQTSDSVEIKEGLNPGEAVITSGLFALQDGSPVEVISDQPNK